MFYKTRFPIFCNCRYFLWILGLNLIHSDIASTLDPSKRSAILDHPGEPLNPDDFEAGKRYLQDLKAGLIQEPPDDPSQEMTTRDDQYHSSDIWFQGMVPYQVSNDFSPEERSIISSAVAEYQPRTCIILTPRTAETDYVTIVKGDSGCFSSVGRTGGAQTLQISDECFRRGSVIHEFLHAVGFNHEHQRSDRDEYISINFAYIKPHLKDQFEIRSDTHNTLTPYDYGSILHYSARSDCIFPCPRRVRIIRKKKRSRVRLGQRDGLSDLDIQRTNILYKCAGRPNSSLANNVVGAPSSVLSKWPMFGQRARQFRGCQDFYERCNTARSYDCQNNTWIRFMCRKSCRLCQNSDCMDYNRRCEHWSRSGQCFQHPEYMLLYCQKSCGLCKG